MTLKASKLNVGDTHEEEVCQNLSRTQIVQYAGTSGDYNPLHSDEIFTTQIAGYPSVFAHGMLSMGMTGKMLTNYVGDGRLRSYGVRFTSQVFPGATLTASATITEIREEDGQKIADIAVSTKDEEGTEVIKGQATALLDP
ncbi:MAG: MaoC/PaaZ C-terminal domain-containing protein [Pseudomonadales bacterium]|jgi:acyl dehydratase|nr:MaoC/PaaZ C-terminal domain-containing protein [Pseudomonadales bacterium]MDP6316732.1 MaoC/PaaZ C-terminal domain-containing protein [Pseudomonadales bacterium]MDP7313492.1 MaoC/PaaZ C-terminal domain-containing protein [Pseudomonadales bacterium]MDP7576040.1 MaoC/PaaZ C-terminal domain-containing protein [Pseudomonadales bacterium]HJP49857.1 MaoC/PaaZ C-terminal domain-containing protein [Pseudomonadales bacterium]|tara:strand:- start:297 stop:719 length:423 start_codon:yes stop_codon:yes gene_type:complete